MAASPAFWCRRRRACVRLYLTGRTDYLCGLFPQTFRFLFFQPTMRRRGCARTRHHNDRPRSPSLRPSLCGHFFVPQKKNIYISKGKHTMMHLRHVSIHHRAHRGTPGHETAVEEPQKRVRCYRSRARVYRDG